MSQRHIHERMEIASDATGQTVIDHIAEAWPRDTVEVVRVVVEQVGAADADWNVRLGDLEVFDGDQTVGAADTPEAFVPDQNRFGADEASQIALDVSTAGSAGGLNATVLTRATGPEAAAGGEA